MLTQEQNEEERKRKIRHNAIKGQYKFCKKCFESGIKKCECLLQALSPQQREIALQEEFEKNNQQVEQKQQLKPDSSLEFNVSLFHDPGEEPEAKVANTFKKVKDSVTK